MGVLMLYACHYPYQTIRIWFFFPLEIRRVVLLCVAFDLHLLLIKISREGRENLSAEEMEILNQASERLRRKKT